MSVRDALLRLHRLHRKGGKALITDVLHRHVSPGRRVVIDFSSPNIAKHFHIGNLRSTLIGRFIDAMQRCAGHEVVAINYLGDWGSQIALLALAFPDLVNRDEWHAASDRDRVRLLTDCYVRANQRAKNDHAFKMRSREIFKEMELQLAAGDRGNEHLEFWRDARELSRRYLTEVYRLWHVHFDSWLFESDFATPANALVDRLIAAGVAKQTIEGLHIVPHENIPRQYAAIRKSDGTTLYLSRDLASLLHRHSLYNADRYLYVVDSAQASHFLSLQCLLSKLGEEDLASRVQHVSYGRVKGLSTRDGVTEVVEEIVANGTALARRFIASSATMKVRDEEMDSVAENLAIASTIVDCVKRARRQDYRFSFENAFKMEQENALLLQMKHSRLWSIEEQNAEILPSLYMCDGVPLCDVSRPLVETLQEFDAAVLKAYQELEPCHLTVFAMKLARQAGSVVAQLRVQGEEKHIARSRLLLLSTARIVLAETMAVLGIQPLDRM